jgi:hypothetical protein
VPVLGENSGISETFTIFIRKGATDGPILIGGSAPVIVQKIVYELWEFAASSSVLNEFSINTFPPSQVEIIWGDATPSTTINSGDTTSHTYT